MDYVRWRDSREGDPVVSLSTLVRGFHAASARFHDVNTLTSSGEETFIALFEALNWTASIDEYLGYPQESAVRGLRFARNRVHHQWANALYFMPGGELGQLVLGVSRLGVSSQWHWRPVDELPTGRRDSDGRQAYADFLARQPAGLTLRLLEKFLLTAAAPQPHPPDG